MTILGYKSEFQSMFNKLTNELCKRAFQEAPEQTNFVSLGYSVTSDRVSLIGSTCGVIMLGRKSKKKKSISLFRLDESVCNTISQPSLWQELN